MRRELLSGVTLGALLGVVGFTRIVLRQRLHFTNYGPQFLSVVTTICVRPRHPFQVAGVILRRALV
jgi:hypothetical protein